MLTMNESRESREHWNFIRDVAANMRRSKEICGVADAPDGTFAFFDVNAARHEADTVQLLRTIQARISPSMTGAQARVVIDEQIAALLARGK